MERASFTDTGLQAIDVSNALEAMLHDDTTAGETYELYGPTNYSLAEIAELVDREIVKHRRHINLPKFIIKPAAHYLNKLLWWPMSSGDIIEREFIDQTIDPTAKTFKDLGIEPADLKNLTFHYLVRRCIKLEMSEWYWLTICAERIPQLFLLRPSPGDGAGKEGGEAVLARFGQPVV